MFHNYSMPDQPFLSTQNCRENTMGPNCEVCVTGYYGNPDLGPCKPCACPTRQQNFAETCQADRFAEYVCNCRTGYTGSKCDRQVKEAAYTLISISRVEMKASGGLCIL